MEDLAKEVEVMEVRNMVMINKSVNDTKNQPLSIAKNWVHPVANNEVPPTNYCCCVGQELQEM